MASQKLPKSRKEPVSGFSPAPGCLIIIFGILTIIGLGSWAVFTFTVQNREIATFTTDSAIEITPVVPNGETEPLIAKLTTFRYLVKNRKKAELSLNLRELNVLLTTDPFSRPPVPLNTMIQGEKIADGVIHAKISFPLNRWPPGSPPRYLNGTILIKPATTKGKGLVMLTENIQVDGKTIAEGFLRRYQQDGYVDIMLVEDFREEKKGLGPIIKVINGAKIVGNQVVVSFDPTPKPAESEKK
jgi:hypothetical protein